MSDSSASDRVRTLLLRGDNVLKHGRSPDKAREAFQEALEAAQDPSVDSRVRELVERRLQSLDEAG